MRLFASLLLILSVSLCAQEKAKKGPPKNLKLLPPDTNIREVMQGFEKALGVTQCTYCHVQGDFASDANPKKETARMMISMARDLNAKFPDGKQHISCFTCHRGNEMPLTEAGAQ